MKKQELNNRASRALHEFDSMENLQPSAEWHDSLMEKLAVVKPNSIATYSSSKLAILIFFVLMTNIGFVFKTVRNDSQQIPRRANELQLISKELLINSSPINN